VITDAHKGRTIRIADHQVNRDFKKETTVQHSYFRQTPRCLLNGTGLKLTE